MKLDGRTEPTKWQRKVADLRYRIRNRLLTKANIQDGDRGYVFRCESPVELWRAMTLFVKEEGTVAWLKRSVGPSDVVYDIGANVGLYTLLAAHRVGDDGIVYAFEPHVANANSLLHNIAANDLNGRVKVLTTALNDKEGFFEFNYNTWVPGSSMSQLHRTQDDQGRDFTPVFSELKSATTIDRLLACGAVRPANVIKIDVDGNELLILKGMRELLTGANRPRSVQVEISPAAKASIYDFLASVGYVVVDEHDTLAGKRKRAISAGRSDISYNAVFEPQP